MPVGDGMGLTMDSALIVSASAKGSAYFREALRQASILEAKELGAVSEARRHLSGHQVDLVVVNAPLPDESGESLAREVTASGDAMAILVVKYEVFGAVTAVVAPEGVLTVSKPIDDTAFWAALQLARSAQVRMRRLADENAKLLRRIEDIRIIDRAKLLLIANYKLSEQDAHRQIEKQAMDMRLTRRQVAEEILRMYDN
jgi:response regulator NasT